MTIKLYDLPLSPNSRKVRAVLLELGIEAEIEVVNVREGKNKSPEFLKLNPNGKLPTIVDDGFALWESNAILTYLAAKTGKLLPADPKGRAYVAQWLFWQSSHFGPAVGKVGFERILKPLFGVGTPDEAVIAAGTRDFETLCGVMTTSLEGREYLAGELSIADFSVASWAEFGLQAGLSFDKFPQVKAWFERVSARDSFKQSAAKR